jgi:hypothetical protein
MNSKNNQDNISSDNENNSHNFISIEQEEIKYDNIKGNDENELSPNKEEENEKEDQSNNIVNSHNNNIYANKEENEDIKITKKSSNNDNNINNNIVNNNRDNNDVTVSNLLFQLKQMSDRQLYLLDIISNLQKNSSEQINHLNKRIKDLETKLNKNNGDNNDISQNEQYLNNYPGEDNPNNTLAKILNGKSNEKLIKYLNMLKLDEIKKLDIKLIEDTLIKLCILLTEGFKIHEIINFIKGILIINKIKLKPITKKNLKDILNYIQSNLEELKDEDSVDISLLISYLNI